jgi:hypothetical protein
MPQSIEIKMSMERVGEILFDEAPSNLIVSRTASGFRFSIPASIKLRSNTGEAPLPMVTNLRAVISINKDPQTEIQVGIAEDLTWYLGGGNSQANLIWADVMPALAYIEQCRDGQRPQLKLELRAEGCWLLQHQSQMRIRTAPQFIGGKVTLTYPKEVWVKMLRDIKFSENVLLEIPLPSTPPTQWDKVWSAFLEARSALEQGGALGWKSCVSAIRLALEEWRSFEKEEMGPGGTTPTANDLKSRNKQQRYDNLRWHLIQSAHLGPHSSAEDWSRDDATFLLATLSALLAVRKP